MTLQQSTGEQIRKIRQEHNLSQVALSELVEIDQKHISNIEAGKVNLTLNTLERLADVLGKEVIITFK